MVNLGSRFDDLFRPGPDRRLFHGWKIVGAGATLQLMIAGLFLQAYGAYVVLLQADFGWSRTMLSAGFSIARTESALLGPVQGYLIDRFGPRAIMRVGVVAFALGFMALSQIQHPWQFFAAIVLIAIGASLAGFLSVTVAVVNWFTRRRATALGMAQVGFALGGVVVPALVVVMNAFGWRVAAFGSGAIMLVLGPLVTRPVRHKPAELGLYVDGVDPVGATGPGAETGIGTGPQGRGAQETTDGSRAAADQQVAAAAAADFTGREALRTPAFWLISFGHGFAVVLISALMVHLIPHLTGELGYSLTVASLVVAALTILQAIGMVVGGLVGDRLDKRAMAVVSMLMHAGGVLLLSIATSPLLLVLFVLIHGTAWGVRAPLLQAWRADLFGGSNFGAIMGFSSMVVMFGAAGGPLFAGFLYDRLGNYTLTMQLLVGLALAGSVLFLLVRTPTPTARQGG